MRDFVHAARRTVEDGQGLVLAAITASSGSTPRGTGAVMGVRPDGSILGTVGGGLVEALTQRAAAELLDPDQGPDAPAARLVCHQLDNELASKSDMICGGEVEVLLVRLPGGDRGATTLAALDEALRLGRPAALVLAIQEDEGGPKRLVGLETLEPEQAPMVLTGADRVLAAATRDAALSGRRPVLGRAPGLLVAALPFAPAPSVYIFGAGHVSRPTAQMARIAGLRAVVLDDRAEFANRRRFPDADEVLVPPDMDAALDGLDVRPEDSLVIVTRGHLHDKAVLDAALRTPARYVGMIGSRRKRDAIYEALRAEGVPQASIDRCRCPIGLDIGARTPEEIAVSIVAELVQCRTAAEGGKKG